MGRCIFTVTICGFVSVCRSGKTGCLGLVCWSAEAVGKFSIVSTTVDSPQKNEPALSLSEISNRRLHLLEIRNPNSRAISDLQIATQFPEAILAISAGEKPANYKVDSAENRDKQ